MSKYPLTEKFLGFKLDTVECISPSMIERELASAPVVYGIADSEVAWFRDSQPNSDTHSARLLLIEPIVKESEERQLLRELVYSDMGDRNQYWKYCEALEKAKRLLDGDK